ncbi:hypothetical protein AXE65_02960 [Ventosimonas gracilis]|uniref:TonB-dependent receptor n=1 Tax=Ventosimonas gracilis TaxID=1680762 RepID=A0A139SSN0_9GAMM|nr:TonB-dependent hemoglobin/transferrin/lactoferrin family receptor [Ventosimonas gracilis]KXU37567.1 hypothetical protein AXE65_02960 [Ventosimonas gracilis]
MTILPSPLRDLWPVLLLLASPVLAEENELPPTAIISTPPAAPTVSETDAQTLQQRQIRSFDDLGKQAEPGVNFNRQSQSINIRGLEQSRVLTTIDGIRQPWLNDGVRGAKGGLDTVDFNSLSRLDIVRGAGSAEVGSGALGGALQLMTLNPADLLGEGRDFGTLLKTDYDSADQSYGLNSALAARYQGSAFLLQVSGRRGHELQTRGTSGGFGNRRSKANPADSEQHSVLLKVQQRLGEHELGLTGEYFERENDIDSRTNQSGVAGGYQIGQNGVKEIARRERISLNWRFTDAAQNSLIDQAESTLYWQRQRRHDDQRGVRIALPDGRAFIPVQVINFLTGLSLTSNPYAPLAAGYPSGAFGRDNQIEKELWGLSGKLDKGFTLASLSQRVSLGVELYREDTEQFSKGYDNCPTINIPKEVVAIWGPAPCELLHSNQADMPKSEGTHAAIYANNEIRLNPALTLTPALRYDYYQEKPGASPKNNVQPINGGTLKKSSDNKLSASLLATWQAGEQRLFYAQIAQGFRAPDATELYMNYGAPNNYLSLGNQGLKAEQSTHFELGGQWGDEPLGGKVSLFDSRYKHFIDSAASASAAELAAIGIDPADYPLGVTRAQNLERVRIFGSELSAHWRFAENLKLWGQAAFARGRDRDSGQYLNSVAPLSGLLGLSLEQDELGADLMLRSAAARTKTAGAGDFKAPGYGVVDFTAHFQPKAFAGLRVQAGLFNLFNKKYWNAISMPNGTLAQPADYYSEAGRSVRAAIVWQY